MTRKIIKKETKRLDEFQSVFWRIIKYISENRGKFFLLSGILVFFILFSSGWYFYGLNYEKNAQKMHLLAFNSYHKDNNNDRETYLNAVNLYKKLVGKYPNSNAAKNALYSMGNIYFDLNEMDKSINAYEEFIKKSKVVSELTILAYIGLGYCYEAKGNYAKALESLDNSIKYGIGGSYEGIIYRNMARIYEDTRNHPKAIEYYKKALKQTTDPSMEALLKIKISTLG